MRVLVVAALAGWLALPAPQTDLRTFVGRTVLGLVTTVVDGDTIHLRLDSGRDLIVRLEGIDCPETPQPFSTQARTFTRVMLFDRRVLVRATDVDVYSRLVGRVTIGQTDSSVELVKAGLACQFARYPSDSALAAAQADARSNARGFWGPGATRPPACNANAAVAASPAGPFHGNTDSRVYHARSCPNYNCRNCTQVFQDEADAKRAGFRPASDCIK